MPMLNHNTALVLHFLGRLVYPTLGEDWKAETSAREDSATFQPSAGKQMGDGVRKLSRWEVEDRGSVFCEG